MRCECQFPILFKKTRDRKLTPRAGVRDIEVVSAFLRWELSSRFPRDPVSEDRRLALELSGFIGWVHPIGDFRRVSCLRDMSISCQEIVKMRRSSLQPCFVWRRMVVRGCESFCRCLCWTVLRQSYEVINAVRADRLYAARGT